MRKNNLKWLILHVCVFFSEASQRSLCGFSLISLLLLSLSILLSVCNVTLNPFIPPLTYFPSLSHIFNYLHLPITFNFFTFQLLHFHPLPITLNLVTPHFRPHLFTLSSLQYPSLIHIFYNSLTSPITLITLTLQ